MVVLDMLGVQHNLCLVVLPQEQVHPSLTLLRWQALIDAPWQEISEQIFFFLPLLPLRTSLSPNLSSASVTTGIPLPNNSNDKDLCSASGADTLPPILPPITITHLDTLKPSDFSRINGVTGSERESGDHEYIKDADRSKSPEDSDC